MDSQLSKRQGYAGTGDGVDYNAGWWFSGVRKPLSALEPLVDANIDWYNRSLCHHRSDPIRLYRCLLYTSPSPRDGLLSRMPSSA